MVKYFLSFIILFHCTYGNNIENYLNLAGDNQYQLIKALNQISADKRKGLSWLIKRMPLDDLKTLSSEYLLINTSIAYEAWINSPWFRDIPENIFLDNILPYANLNERRDNRREEFRKMFLPLISDAKSLSEAAAILNNSIFEKLDVVYSTKRPKADQSPGESITAGMASCTGLSILLISACRSVGIPARFVGTSNWYDNSGNHSWVEIWDDGWHFTGAAEPTELRLNDGWFIEKASKAQKGSLEYGIFSVTWNKVFDNHFPMDWLPGVESYRSYDVSDYYNQVLSDSDSSLVPISFRVFDSKGQRKSKEITISGPDNFFFTGLSKNEENDTNDHLIVRLPRGKMFKAVVDSEERQFTVIDESLIDFKVD